ncbi:MAG: hypothetical protein V4726_04205 [Verrucomicrobiota bacterium]
MKIQLKQLLRGLLLTAAAAVLSNCASSGGGSFKSPAPMATAPEGPVGGTGSNRGGNTGGYAPIEADSDSISRGLRFGSDALTNNAIDSLIAGGSATVQPVAGAPKKRSGLATQAGGERWDRLTSVSFYRKATGAPDAVDSFNYNDEAGAKAMAEALSGGRRRSGTFEAAGGRLEVGLRSGWGMPFDRYEAGNRRIVAGNSGSAYQISIKNTTRHPVEVVASVDGLDVMDGKAASTGKRGYIIDAKGELSIEGFRISNDKVKQFVFGSVDSSAASKAGMARNVGVIGLAVYDEDEAQAKLARLVESQKRGAASAFPVNTR